MREELDIITAYNLVGTYRGAAAICGTTHKTVKNVVLRHAAGGACPERGRRGPRNYEVVRDLVATAVESSKGRISAKRLLPRAWAAGYTGSPRNFRRLVADEKKRYRGEHGRRHRPASWSPGEHLVIDWGVIAGVHVFAAVLAWSRFRFVRFASDEKAATTMSMLAECFEVLGGHPQGRPRRPDGLPEGWGGRQPGRAHPGLCPVRHALPVPARLLRGGRPRLQGRRGEPGPLRQGRRLRPLLLEHAQGLDGDEQAAAARILADLGGANQRAADWCAEVNAAVHSEIAAVPQQRLATEVDPSPTETLPRCAPSSGPPR